jgi:hypothetical protein
MCTHRESKSEARFQLSVPRTSGTCRQTGEPSKKIKFIAAQVIDTHFVYYLFGRSLPSVDST